MATVLTRRFAEPERGWWVTLDFPEKRRDIKVGDVFKDKIGVVWRVSRLMAATKPLEILICADSGTVKRPAKDYLRAV
jgi:hypothetical protein